MFFGDENKLIFTHHHVLMDGWSSGILLKEFIYLYNNKELPEEKTS